MCIRVRHTVVRLASALLTTSLALNVVGTTAVGGQAPDVPASVLRLLQEIKGWLVPDGVKRVAQLLETTPERAHEVATFYIMFFTEKPGKYVIDVCTNLPCALRGAEGMLRHLEAKLGTLAGTNGDKYYLRETECLASCGTAPCLQINEDHHENLTKTKVDQILEKLS